MKNVVLPITDNCREKLISAYTYADGQKKYDYTEDELTLILELYKEYDNSNGTVSQTHPKLLELSETLKNATKEAYNEVQKGGRLKDFRKKLLSSSKKCPICRFTASTTLDHQLPKDLFEIYSIYSSNLVPMCWTCNNLKRTCNVGDTSESFYHIYYEQLPNEQFLKAKLTIENETFLSFTFYIERTVSMDETLYSKLKFIFKKLNLDERLNAEANEYICDLNVSFKKQEDTTIQQFLDESIVDKIDRFGYNHWKVAILNSLKESKEFYQGLYKIYNIEKE